MCSSSISVRCVIRNVLLPSISPVSNVSKLHQSPKLVSLGTDMYTRFKIIVSSPTADFLNPDIVFDCFHYVDFSQVRALCFWGPVSGILQTKNLPKDLIPDWSQQWAGSNLGNWLYGIVSEVFQKLSLIIIGQDNNFKSRCRICALENEQL